MQRVHALGIQDGQPLIQKHVLFVEWHPDHPIDDSEYDRDYNNDEYEEEHDEPPINNDEYEEPVNDVHVGRS